ncbi:MAG: hypothetical protein IPG97_08640 [Microthrixaceae bacterium]|nr:hypothetical protein [Microthrixaceae bacterium]
MPELLEVEAYRLLAETVVGCRIEHVETPDEWFLKGVTALEVTDALTGATVAGTRRIGKLLTVSVGETRPLLGLRFGMTGRLLLDDDGPIDRLEYAPGRDDPAWDRFCAGSRRPTSSARHRSSSIGWCRARPRRAAPRSRRSIGDSRPAPACACRFVQSAQGPPPRSVPTGGAGKPAGGRVVVASWSPP